jgi:hypothetical protein
MEGIAAAGSVNGAARRIGLQRNLAAPPEPNPYPRQDDVKPATGYWTVMLTVADTVIFAFTESVPVTVKT